MPTSIEDLSTDLLLDIADGTDDTTDFTPAQALAELKYRVIPQNDISVSYTEYRGGIRPTHIPTH